MKKSSLISLIVITIFSLVGAANAGMLIPAAPQALDHAKAPEKSPVISETSFGEWDLERVDFVHYVKPNNPAKQPKTETCYKLMGVKWLSLPVSYVINPTNNDNMTEDFVATVVSSSAETWDDATSQEIFSGSSSIDYTKQYGMRDYANAIVFGSFSDNNIIGVTSIWYSKKTKQIVEFDIKFNDYFAWGEASIDASLMDLANIATHELGHAVGMSDVYSTACMDVTMYGYSGEGETIKRTLAQPDINGLQSMYGV